MELFMEQKQIVVWIFWCCHACARQYRQFAYINRSSNRHAHAVTHK